MKDERPVTFDDFNTMMKPIRAKLANRDIANLSQDMKALTARLDTLDVLTNHHLERLDSYTPVLIAEAKRASAQGKELLDQMAASIAAHEAAQKRLIEQGARLMQEAQERLVQRDFWGRMLWLLRGK